MKLKKLEDQRGADNIDIKSVNVPLRSAGPRHTSMDVSRNFVKRRCLSTGMAGTAGDRRRAVCPRACMLRAVGRCF